MAGTSRPLGPDQSLFLGLELTRGSIRYTIYVILCYNLQTEIYLWSCQQVRLGEGVC